MKYSVKIGDREFEVVVDGDTVSLNGSVVAASLASVADTPLRQLRMNGSSKTYVVRRDGDGWSVGWGGEFTTVEVEDERTRALKQLAGAATGRQRGGAVKAPMPGLVVRVGVEEGQEIEAGASVIVLEAMKMENEIAAPTGGVVKAVRVRPGQAVEKGAVLVEVAAQT